MHVSVEQSLQKLRTSYIDLLYLHWWDWDTSVEEVMRGLHTLVHQGKVLYLVSPIFLIMIIIIIHLKEKSFKNIYREFPIPLLGLYRRQINMRVIML